MTRGTIRRIATATLLASAVAFASPAVAQDAGVVDVPRAQAGAIAQAALRDGRTDIAFSIASAMLARDPDDPEGHLIMAVLARGVGDLDTADEAATRAWRNARTDAQRFDAAFIAADIAARQERLTSSQIWLRRADQYAPNEAAEQAVARAYRGVSTRNPLKVQLSFTLRPSDNLNNGGEIDGPLNAEPAVGGIEIGAGATLSYRLSESAEHRTEFVAQTYLRRAILDSDDFAAFNATPSGPIDRTEFDFATLSFGLSHRQSVFDGLGPTGLRATIGASYYRNEHLSNFGEIGVTQDFRQGETALWRVGVTLRDETRIDSPAASYGSGAVSLDHFARTDSGLGYSFGATVTQYNSAAPTVDGAALALRARVDLGRDIWGARPDLALGFQFRDLPDFSPGIFGPPGFVGRIDRTVTATLGLTFEDTSWYGFQPRVEFTARDLNSNLDIWDSRAFGVGATLVSRF